MNRLDTLYSINKFSKLIGVTPQTLRNWEREGKLIPVKKSSNGYRYYSEEQRVRLQYGNLKERKVIGYCRVSTQKQKDDLERQVENVKAYCIANGYQFEIITDIGSGINYTKDGLNKLIDKVIAGEVSKVVVLYKDRLIRFGFELIEEICLRFGTYIEIIDTTEKIQEQELVEELVQIITVFSCRLQGKRSKKTRELIQELQEGGD